MTQRADISQLIDQHVHSHVGFAIYRLPAQEHMRLTIQTSGTPQQIANLGEIDAVKGFVIAPFDTNSQLPIVTISPDVEAEGEVAIVDLLSTLPKGKALTVSAFDTVDMTRESYDHALSAMVKLMRTTELRKVVLARSKKARRPKSLGRTFIETCQQNPDFFVYLCHSPLCGTWLGATPETLLRKRGNSFRTIALAGTKPADTNEVWSEKNITEQQYVHDYILNVISHLTSSPAYIDGPRTLQAGCVEHRCSTFDFDSQASLGQIITQLHPTPAVCGQPKSLAMKALAAHEATNRLYYSGVIGVVNRDTADLFVNLRCLTADDNQTTLFAGGGLLSESTSNAEWNETELKMRTLQSIIDNENL